jgi:peptide/nickel transport system substrate-binding protein
MMAAGACAQKEIPSDRLVVLVESYPANLDPRIGTDQASARFFHLAFEGLTRVGPQGEILPLLAERWEVDEAEKKYTFHLRRDAVFHHGKAFGAEDVAFTYGEFLKEDFISAKKEPYETIEAVEALDAHTVRFRLRRPFASFLNAAALGVVPSDGAHTAERPVGTGPFALAEARRDSHVLLRAHAAHPAPPAVREIELRVVPDATAREMALQKGSAHLAINNILPTALPRLERDPSLRVVRAPGGNFTYLGFNLEDALLSRPEVRRAVAHAVDRKRLIEGLLEGLGREADSVLPPHLWAHADDVPRHPYDPERARALLDGAGLRPDPDGVRFRLLYKTSTESLARRKAVLLQEFLRAVGIALDIRSYEFATFYEDIRRGNFQLYSLTWVGMNDPDLLHYIFHTSSMPPRGANRGRYGNARVDELLDAARSELDNRIRKTYYEEVQRIVAAELPYVPLWYSTNVAVASRRVEGLELWPAGEFTPLAGARLRP